MPLFTWDPIYSVGEEKIDAQHKQLFDIANRFKKMCSAHADRASLLRVYKELLDYTAVHFADEEALLRRHHYPDYDNHKMNHDKLVGLVKRYQIELETGGADVEARIQQFVQTWLNGHILGTDRNYRDHIKTAA
jgi:hemerythrin